MLGTFPSASMWDMPASSSDSVPTLRFANPPVVATRLELGLQLSAPLSLVAVADLLCHWSEEYPHVIEQPPNNPIRKTDDGLRMWPLPSVRLVSEDDKTSLAFSEESFEISWRFQEASNYPGYDDLSQQLENRLAEFEAILTERDIDFQITSAECQYENVIAMTAGDLAVGVMTDWTGQASALLPSRGGTKLQLHGCRSEDVHHCSSYLFVDEGDTDDACALVLLVRHETNPESGRLGGLESAHSELIELFDRYTTATMHQQWGIE